MNRTIDGTEYRDTQGGIIVIRGKRQLHMLGTSVDATEKARALIASTSFNRLFAMAKRSPFSRNVASINLKALRETAHA